MNRPRNRETIPLTGALRGDDHRAGEAQAGQPEELVGREIEGEFGQRRGRGGQHRGADQAAHGGTDEAGAERPLGLALAGQREGLVDIGGRGRGSGNAQERARDVAGEDGHGGAGGDGGDGGHRVHEEGDRHQQRGGHGRRQAGNRADEQPEGRRHQDDRQDVDLEDQLEGLRGCAQARSVTIPAARRMPQGRGTSRNL